MIKKLINSKNFLITSFTLVVSMFLSIICLIPNDYWWHFKAGEYMVKTKSIPFTDVFSWYGIENNLYWSSHEWLSEVVYYLVGNAFGFIGITIFIFLCVAGLFMILYKGNENDYKENFGFTLFWVLLGLTTFFYLISPRPHMISFMFLALTICFLYDYRNNENSKKIWGLPIISLLWVNFHGGSSNLIYILPILFIVTGLFEFRISSIVFDKLSKKQIKTLFIVAIVSLLVLAINPHGVSMIIYPYENMNDATMLAFIGEWRSPNLKNILDFCFVLPIIIPVLILIKSKKDILFVDLLLIGAFSYLTLKSIRFAAFMYIASSFIIFRYLDGIDFKSIKYIRDSNFKDFAFYVFKRLYLILIGSLLLFNVLVLFTNPIAENFSRDGLPVEIIEKIKEENPKQLFNHYNYGGYLIYNDIKPLIDGRADMYSKTLLKDYVNLINKSDSTLLDRYDFDYFLLPKGSGIDNYIKSHSEKYEVILEKDDCVFYKTINN